MITPTSKKTGMPSRKPAAVSASGVRRLPNFSINVVASDCAPPDSSMIRPTMAPRAMMMAMWPRTEPMPSSIVLTRSFGDTPAASATMMLTDRSATKGWNLNLRTSSSRSATPPRAISNSTVGFMAR